MRSITYAKNGNFSFKLTPGNAEDNYGQAAKYFKEQLTGRIGFECSFGVTSEVKTVSFGSMLQSPTHYYSPALRYDVQNEKIEYRNSAGTYTEIDDVSLGYVDNTGIANIIKLVVDFNTNYYLRGYLNEDEFDLSTYAIQETANEVSPFINNYVYATNNSTGVHSLYIDNIIITQNEPYT